MSVVTAVRSINKIAMASDTISSIQINNLIWDTNSTFNIETLRSSGWEEAPDIMVLGDTVGVTVA